MTDEPELPDFLPDETRLSAGWIDVPPVPRHLPLPEGGNGGDIRIRWYNEGTLDFDWSLGDWGLAEGDIETGQDLETACLVSLFTDKLATPDFVPTDGTTDRRGWWADYYEDRPLGSNLWQLERAKKTRSTLGIAQRYTQDSLQWLIDDGIASVVIVNCRWLAENHLGIAIAITKPNGTHTRFMFGWAWDNLSRLRSPIYFPEPFA